MEPSRTRRWTDREGGEWEVVFNPSVELDTQRDRTFRERILFRGAEGEYHAPAVFGSDLSTLSDDDLQGLLEQAREAQSDRGSAWSSPPGKDDRSG